jgi:NhaP-type Na+/H+ and K+/H+ antiporter
MVLTSMLIQGPTLMPLARKLGLAAPLAERARIPLELEVTSASRNQEMFEFEVPPDAPFAGTPIAALGLPPGVLVLLIRRDDEFLQPHGDTEVRVSDGLLIMGDHEAMAEVHSRFFPSVEYQPVRSYEEIRHSMPPLKHFRDYLKR